jgi:putative methyltransferase (TIGR04325 family)
MTQYVPHKVLSMIQGARKIPPFEAFLRARYEHDFATARNANLFRGIFNSAAEAAASAPAGGPLGYDHPDPAAQYRERLVQVYPTDYPVLFWLKNILGDVRTVFDLGGHVGVARYAYERYLQFPEGLRWQVCDVPAVVEAGAKLAAERGISGLTFTTDRNHASAADLYHAAGVLQYL